MLLYNLIIQCHLYYLKYILKFSKIVIPILNINIKYEYLFKNIGIQK